MRTLLVVNNPNSWPLHIPGVEVVDARSYLADPEYAASTPTLLFNLCKSYRYQSSGYYVSLLAAARGHRPLPSVATMQDMKSMVMLRYASEELERVIQESLEHLHSKHFTLSVYFGRNIAKRYDRLSRHLFNLFDAPLLRADFVKEETWRLQKINPIGAKEIPEDHWDFVVESATAFFSGSRYTFRKRKTMRYDLAILQDPQEKFPPSDPKALAKFVKAAEQHGLEAELISRDDYGRLAEFDALFIRETTAVNHHTFRFSRRAVAEGLVVIDDPESILKCSNKVYLAELLARHKISAPQTLILHKENIESGIEHTGLPAILKQPDSAFSQGVFKVETREQYLAEAQRLLEDSELIIAQEFIPTDFDWRVGIIDGQPLYVCRYYMARRHWQIQKTDESGKIIYGRADTLAVEDAPPQVVRAALKAANLFGRGLYGVDLKEKGRRYYVIEVNDNPSIDAGIEDEVLKDALYEKIMAVFLQRIEATKKAAAQK